MNSKIEVLDIDESVLVMVWLLPSAQAVIKAHTLSPTMVKTLIAARVGIRWQHSMACKGLVRRGLLIFTERTLFRDSAYPGETTGQGGHVYYGITKKGADVFVQLFGESDELRCEIETVEWVVME